MAHRIPVVRRSARHIFMVVVMLAVIVTSVVPPAGAVSAANTAVLPPVPSAQGWEPVFEPGPCDFPETTNLALQMPLECGTITVPEQHADPDGPAIRLAVAILRSTAPNPDPIPVIFLQGGPGGSTIDLYLQLVPLNPRLNALNRDIILFDQRGTLYSQPNLFCEETYQLGIDLLDDDIPDEEADRMYLDALTACRDRLAAQTDLSAYDSIENAADVDAVRRALGYEQVHLYGVSYGTLLALHVLRVHPEGLASVILDSVVPPQVQAIADQPRVLNRGLNALFDACAQDEACSRAYPNLEEEFYFQIDRLNEDMDTIYVTDYETGTRYPALLDGDTVLYMVIQMLYSTDLIPLIPRTIYQIRAGDYRVAETILSNVVFDRSLSYGMYYSVMCAEDSDYNPAEVDLEGLPPALFEDQKTSVEQFLQVCDIFDVEPIDAGFTQPVQSDVPTLVLSGEFDPVTPPEYAAQAVETLGNNYNYVIPVGGHSQLTSGECQDSIVIQFMNNPDRAPDTSCIAAMEMSFSTPGALVVMPNLISLLNPQGTDLLWIILYGLSALFLLSAILIYPIVWLVRKFSGPKPVTTASAPYALPETPAAPTKKPLLYRLGPWIAGITGIMLVVFIAVVFAIALQMALANDNRVLFGLPGSARPLFVLPLLAVIASVLMLFGASAAWTRGSGSVWGRLYFSLLALAGSAASVVLFIWGAVQALFVL